jgi:hypothetical protein
LTPSWEADHLATNILGIQEITYDWTIERDSDVVEGVGYYDSLGNTTSLAGIDFFLTVRSSETGPVRYYVSTKSGELQVLQSSPTDTTTNVLAWVVLSSQFPAFLPVGQYFFNIQAVADGRKRTVSSGNMFVVTKGATAGANL